MIKQYGELFFYIHSRGENIIYNRITDPESGRSCYPDILVRHGLREDGIEDAVLYRRAEEMQKIHGTSKCFFMSALNDGIVDAFAALVLSAYGSCRTAPPFPVPEEADGLCGDLALSRTMSIAFKQLLQYYSLTADAGEFIRSVRRRYKLPVNTKSEGKKIYEAVRTEILR